MHQKRDQGESPHTGGKGHIYCADRDCGLVCV